MKVQNTGKDDLCLKLSPLMGEGNGRNGPLTTHAAHGGNIYQMAAETGISEDKLIDFSASINPLGISKSVRSVITKGLGGLVNYPDPDTKSLRQKLAQVHGIDPETIICGNGSTELIYLIPRALHPETALIPAPTFSEYERAVRMSNELRVMSYELRKGNNFRIVPDEFINAMLKSLNSSLVTRHLSPPSAIAFLCNPNNPTGHLLKKDEVLKIAEAARKMKCMLVVDEAFIDFFPEQSVLKEVQCNPYLIVLRSMTKFFALTGLRIGYAVFHESLMQAMRQYKEPWTVNNLAQHAAIAALEDRKYADRTFVLMKREKGFLEKGFRKIGLEFYPSAVNYYLLNVGGRRVVALLREKGILVRDCENFKGLDRSYIRVAVKSRGNNKILLKELGNIVNKIPLRPPFTKGEGIIPSLGKRG